ncbi:nucleotidyltransferase [Spirochaetia bacterium]|nr:nucleotidyltransferase [Spirochaetia bacterium]
MDDSIIFEDAKKFLVFPSIPVRDAIEKIQITGHRTVFVVDLNNTLLGVFSDGDMRRFILNNGKLNDPVSKAMNPSPVSFTDGQEKELKEQIKSRSLLVYPILNQRKQIIKIAYWTNNTNKIHPSQQLPNGTAVVIMAGGKGERLHPITKILPKALIPIEDIPICTRVINSFIKFDCRNFIIILNYKSEMIKAYYNDIHKEYALQFETENSFLGTAGGLYLLKNKIKNTCIVSNCDILVETDFSCIYKWHKKEGNLITFVGAIKEFPVPYGTINADSDGLIQSLQEKPSFSFLINVGVYILEPEVINNLSGEYIDMPDLARKYIAENKKVGVFPVSGNDWLDMGQFKEMEIMSQRLRAKYNNE